MDHPLQRGRAPNRVCVGLGVCGGEGDGEDVTDGIDRLIKERDKFIKLYTDREVDLVAMTEERDELNRAVDVEVECVHTLRIALDSAYGVLWMLEWDCAYMDGGFVELCNVCESVKRDGHKPDCWYALNANTKPKADREESHD